MSGAMRKIGEYLGLLEDTGRYDEYDDYDRDEAAYEAERAARRTPQVREDRAPAPVSDLAARRRPASGPTRVVAERRRPAAGPTGVVAEMSRITTFHPRTYNEARTIGENFRDGTPVIMNLSEMDDTDAKRLVDFAAGLVFATRGTIERVTNRVFLLSPANVHVTAEDKARIAEGEFFQQR
jgi:cell division inhibitor SepF